MDTELGVGKEEERIWDSQASQSSVTPRDKKATLGL